MFLIYPISALLTTLNHAVCGRIPRIISAVDVSRCPANGSGVKILSTHIQRLLSMPGPPPKSAAEKRLTGNPGNRPINTAEPVPAAGAPPKPPHLDEVASQTWDWLMETLRGMQTLRQSDQSVYRRYCLAYSRSVALEIAINRANMVHPVGGIISENDRGQTYISAPAAAESMYAKMLERAEKDLGLTSASRPRIRADAPPAEDDVIAAFFDKPKVVR